MKYIGACFVLLMVNYAKCNYDKAKLIKWYTDAIKYETKIFPYDMTKMDEIILESLYPNHLLTLVNEACGIHQCFFTYNMLIFMYLIPPKKYSKNDITYAGIESACPKWVQKMLKVRIDTNYFKKSTFTSFEWVFYVYTNRMKQLSSINNTEDMEKHYRNVWSYINNNMPEICHKYLGERYFQLHYKLNTLAHNSAQQILKEACERQKATEIDVEGFDIDQLYLNNVIDDNKIMSSLTSSFGILEKSDKIVGLLSTEMGIVKNPKTSLGNIISSLQSVNIYFIKMLKTIMLRVCWTFLNNLKSQKTYNKTLYVDKLKVHLESFADFFRLDSADDFRKLINQLNDWAKTHWLVAINPMSNITRLLKNYDKYATGETMGNDQIESLGKIVFKCSELKDHEKISYNVAGSNEIKTHKDVFEKIRDSIHCAESFVNYLLRILNGINFEFVQVFVVATFPSEKVMLY